MTRQREETAAANAGRQAAAAMRMAAPDTLIRRGDAALGEEDWWYYEAQAMRMARLACYHAFKARPDLRPLSSYEQAVAGYRAGGQA